jgi:hypothetical protein
VSPDDGESGIILHDMNTPILRPTITQQVRTFLDDQGVALRPWSGLDETYRELYGLLNRKKRDPDFWEPLSALLGEVVEKAADRSQRGRLAAPGAELLSSWDVEEVVRKLRASLPGGDGGVNDVRRFTAKLPAAVLGGFLLLGLVAGRCNWSKDCSLDQSSPLWTAIDQKGNEPATLGDAT